MQETNPRYASLHCPRDVPLERTNVVVGYELCSNHSNDLIKKLNRRRMDLDQVCFVQAFPVLPAVFEWFSLCRMPFCRLA